MSEWSHFALRYNSLDTTRKKHDLVMEQDLKKKSLIKRRLIFEIEA